MEKKNRFGPGFLVAAAFIGPGTVTTATLAGAKFGYSLLWVILVAIVATILLQEMVGRFSLATHMNIATALVKLTQYQWMKWGFTVLAFLAIIVGCAAYEAGNIIGGSIGLEIITGSPQYIWVVMISLIAIALLWRRNYKTIEAFLIALVVIMGISFLISAILVKPDFSNLVSGLKPTFPTHSAMLILALLGTTVVPYNLFLHSSTILKKWKQKNDIPRMRVDTFLSIGLGGVITASIIVTAAAAYFLDGMIIKSPADLSIQLSPVYGKWAKVFLGIGLFSAGLSSAITAPYAAAWTASGLFNWPENGWKFRLVFLAIIFFGAGISLIAIKPLEMIVIAQVTNALLLPIVALFIFYLLNKREVGEYKNTLLQNILFVFVFLIIVAINLKKFF